MYIEQYEDQEGSNDSKEGEHDDRRVRATEPAASSKLLTFST